MALPRDVPGVQLSNVARGSFLGPFLSGGAVYVVAIDSADETLLEVHKSSDPDTTAFAEQDGANRPTTAVHFDAVWVVQDGSDLHVLTQEHDLAVRYSIFHMATDLWDGTVVNELVTSTPDTNVPLIGGVIVRSTGVVIVVYAGQRDSFHGNRDRVDYARREGGTWTVDISVDNGGAINWRPGTTVLGASDRAHIFFSDDSNDAAYQRTLNSANVLETFPAAFDATVSILATPIGQKGARYDDGGIIRVRAPYQDADGTLSVAKLDSTSDAPSVSVDTGVSDNGVVVSGLQPIAGFSVDGTTLHLLYVKSGVDKDLLHDENPDDAGWGVDDLELVGVGDVGQTYSNVYVSVATVNLGDTVLAYFYADGGTLKYNERNLSLAASASISSTLSPSSTEDEVVAGGKTLTITLTNDTWVAAGAAFDAQRQNIINGLDSAQAEAAGWDAVVKAGLAVDDVVRTSDTVVTVTFPAFPSYDITVDETITVTVPETAVTGGSPIVATPTFDITAVITIIAPVKAFLTRLRFFRFDSNSHGPVVFRTRNRRRRQDPN